jgi:hypothetical protein
MEPTKLLRLPERRGQKGLERPIHLLLARISGNSPKADGLMFFEYLMDLGILVA